VGGEVVDRCPECAGVWLDDGEVAALKLAEEHIRRYIDLYIRLGQ
jgi:Zn-finger nucleic acid-binding protein